MFMEQGARGPGKPRQLPPSIFYPPPSHAPEACCPHSKHDFRRTKSSKATPTAPKRHTARPLHPPHGHVSASAHRQTSSGVGDRHATRRLRADAAGRACKAVPCRIILGLPELGKLPFPLPPPPPKKSVLVDRGCVLVSFAHAFHSSVDPSSCHLWGHPKNVSTVSAKRRDNDGLGHV